MYEIYEKNTPVIEPDFRHTYNRYYITTDAKGCITSGWSNGPHRDRKTTDAICINEQGGYQFRLFHGGEENPPLYTMDGIPLRRSSPVQKRKSQLIGQPSRSPRLPNRKMWKPFW